VLKSVLPILVAIKPCNPPQLRDHPFRQLATDLNPLFLWLHPTDLKKQDAPRDLLIDPSGIFIPIV
jgi:hypothetical protein